MKKRKTIKQGGKRKNAGRKPIDDKKVPVTIYVKESVIKKETLEGIKSKCYYCLDQLSAMKELS